jgi:hypothetical protein
VPKMYRTITILSLATLILVLLGGFERIAAQVATPTPVEGQNVTPTPTRVPTPTPLPGPVSAFLEAEAVVQSLPNTPATISVSTVVISPRVALRAIVTNGPVLILVDDGTLTIDAEAAIIGPPPPGTSSGLQPDATPSPALAADFLVPEGNQILLPANTRAQLRNTTDEEVELRITAIAPAGQAGFGLGDDPRAENSTG